MKTNQLADVTLKTIENTRHAAAHAVEAYRAGGHRFVGAVGDRLERTVYARTDRLVPRWAERFARMRGRIAELANAGIEVVSTQTGRAIEATSTLAATQVARAAERAAAVENPLLANGLRAAARASLAGARVALAVSARLAQGAVALSTAAGARPKATRRKTAARSERATVAVPRKARGVRAAAAKRTRGAAAEHAVAAAPAKRAGQRRRKATAATE